MRALLRAARDLLLVVLSIAGFSMALGLLARVVVAFAQIGWKAAGVLLTDMP